MNEYLFLIPIALATLVGAISPGSSFLVVAQISMQKSRAHGFAASLGTGTGAVIFTLLASYGLFVVIEKVPWVYLILKFMGGMYLCYLAYKIWKSAKEPIAESNTLDMKLSLYKSYYLGLFTQLTNPKTAIVIGGIIMAFLPSQVPDYSLLLLSMMAFIIDAGWYAVVAMALTTKKAQRYYVRFKKVINRTASGVMGFMGAKLILNP